MEVIVTMVSKFVDFTYLRDEINLYLYRGENIQLLSLSTIIPLQKIYMLFWNISYNYVEFHGCNIGTTPSAKSPPPRYRAIPSLPQGATQVTSQVSTTFGRSKNAKRTSDTTAGSNVRASGFNAQDGRVDVATPNGGHQVGQAWRHT